MNALELVGIIAGAVTVWAAGGIFTARDMYARLCPDTEPVNCRTPSVCRFDGHVFACHRRAFWGDSDQEALLWAVLWGVLWPVLGTGTALYVLGRKFGRRLAAVVTIAITTAPRKKGK